MRLSFEEWAMAIADASSKRATCERRQVGCVTFDKERRILSIGYNGTPKGMPNCVSMSCPGMQPDGEDACMATHAEINALMQCKDVDKIHTVVCTCLPCFRCTKALLNTGMKVLLFRDNHSEADKILNVIPIDLQVRRIF